MRRIGLAVTWSVALGVSAQEFRIVEIGTGDEGYSDVAATPNGYAVAWEEQVGSCSPHPDVAFRMLTPAANFTTGDIVVTQDCNGGQAASIAVSRFGVVFVVRMDDDGDTAGIVGRFFDSAGTPTSGDFVVNQGIAGWQEYPKVAALANATFVVVWGDPFAPGRVLGRIVRSDTTFVTGDVYVSAAGPGLAYQFDVTTMGDTVFAAWSEDPPSGPPYGVMGQVFDGSLMPASSAFWVNQTSIGNAPPAPRVAANATQAMVAWTKDDAAPQPKYDVYARRFDITGAPLGAEYLVNTPNTPTEEARGGGIPASDSSGESVIAWEKYITGIGFQMYARRFDAQGNPVSPEFRANGSTDGNGHTLNGVRMLPSGDFLITWATDRLDFHGSVFGRRYAFPVSLAVAPGPSPRNPATVQMQSPDGRIAGSFNAYAAAYGANVGGGNIDGAGLGELLSGPGPSPVFGPHVRAFQAAGAPIAKVSFYAYGSLKYGVRGDGAALDSDAPAEILTAPGPGAVFGPHVRGFNYDGVALTARSKVSFFAYQTLKYGARATGQDVDGDGFGEIVTGPGPGVMFGSQARGFNYDGQAVSAIGKINFNAFTTAGYGVTVAGSDIESDGVGGWGDGFAEIVAGKGPGPTFDGEMRIFDYDNAAVGQKWVQAASSMLYGLQVTGGDADAGDAGEVVTAPGPDPAAPARIIVWEWDPDIIFGTIGATLRPIGPDDFTTFAGMSDGASVAVVSLQ